MRTHGTPESGLVAEKKTQRLLLSFFLPLILVVATGFALHFSLGNDTWWYSFLFKRSFVQWVLITAFTIGLCHLLLLRWPALRRERGALKLLEKGQQPTGDTLVARRWAQVEAARERQRGNIDQYAKNLAEHDDAEIDSAYRLSGDIVQVLPLIGFFGTVFGLSHGLYSSFLTTGGTTTKDFAKAIAIAFDNTLLGLALTIILFIVQSVLRKREEATLLQLNLRTRDIAANASPEPIKELPQVIIDGLDATLKEHGNTLKELQVELAKSRRVLETPGEGIKTAIQTHTAEVVTGVVNKIVETQRAEHERIAQNLSAKLEEQVTKLFDLVSQRTNALAQLGDPARDAVKDLKIQLGNLISTAQIISDTVAAFAKNTTQPQLEDLSMAVKALVAALSQRDAMMLERLHSLEETRTKLDAVALETRTVTRAVAGFGVKLDAVPDERRRVEDLAFSIKELASVLAQRDSVMLTHLQGSLDAHSRDIKNEIRLPRTIKFVEAPTAQRPDGEPQSQ